jgi:biotin transporter BioY
VPDLALSLAALFPHSPTPYIALMLAGFAVGILGHLTGARWLVAAGVALIFLGALLFPLAANVTTGNKPPPIEESRGDSGE